MTNIRIRRKINLFRKYTSKRKLATMVYELQQLSRAMDIFLEQIIVYNFDPIPNIQFQQTKPFLAKTSNCDLLSTTSTMATVNNTFINLLFGTDSTIINYSTWFPEEEKSIEEK